MKSKLNEKQELELSGNKFWRLPKGDFLKKRNILQRGTRTVAGCHIPEDTF